MYYITLVSKGDFLRYKKYQPNAINSFERLVKSPKLLHI